MFEPLGYLYPIQISRSLTVLWSKANRSRKKRRKISPKLQSAIKEKKRILCKRIITSCWKLQAWMNVRNIYYGRLTNWLANSQDGSFAHLFALFLDLWTYFIYRILIYLHYMSILYTFILEFEFIPDPVPPLYSVNG